MITKPPIQDLLTEAEHEVERFTWEGTFADYLGMVSKNPSVSRLSHRLAHDAIMANGTKDSATGESVCVLFKDQIFGMDEALDKIVHYFASSARRLEIRKRILLLLGPPASGKSSIVALIKSALERHTRTDEGAVYAIKDCPMQEDPLHLIPHQARPKFLEQHGIYVEGDLCPRCRYNLRTRYNGRISEMPVTRFVFSEQEAIGIGYYVATHPNPSDASLLVGSVDTAQLEGDRLDVAGKAFRLDGEFNVANRGVVELVEIFKANKHLLTTLLGLAQEQLIKMDRFGSVYADEVIIGHSNEGDYAAFLADESSEALRDRIIAIQIPYNLKVRDEVKIYEKMLESSGLEDVHVPPLTLPVMSTFAVLTRLVEPPKLQGMSLLGKLRLYDGQWVPNFSQDDAARERRQRQNEGMSGLSPRYVMNRLSASASEPDVWCVSPLKALDSLWQGLSENVSLEEADRAKYFGFLKVAVDEYNRLVIHEIRKALRERFEQDATELLADYVSKVVSYQDTGRASREAELTMREIETNIHVPEARRRAFRQDVYQFFSDLSSRQASYDYQVHPALKRGIEERLFPSERDVKDSLNKQARDQVEMARIRRATYDRLTNSYGYCPQCAQDTIEYVIYLLNNRKADWTAALRPSREEGIEWLWSLNPVVSAPS